MAGQRKQQRKTKTSPPFDSCLSLLPRVSFPFIYTWFARLENMVVDVGSRPQTSYKGAGIIMLRMSNYMWCMSETARWCIGCYSFFVVCKEVTYRATFEASEEISELLVLTWWLCFRFDGWKWLSLLSMNEVSRGSPERVHLLLSFFLSLLFISSPHFYVLHLVLVSEREKKKLPKLPPSTSFRKEKGKSQKPIFPFFLLLMLSLLCFKKNMHGPLCFCFAVTILFFLICGLLPFFFKRHPSLF